MAVLDFIPVIGAGNGNTNVLYGAQLGAAASSTLITTGADMIIRVSVTGPCAIRFGTVANLSTVTSTDILLPGPGAWLFDMGHQNTAVMIYSFNATTNVTVNQVQKG